MKRTLPLALLCLAACIKPVPEEDRPCPCESGWTCCPSNNRCVHASSLLGCAPPGPSSDAGPGDGGDAGSADAGPDAGQPFQAPVVLDSQVATGVAIADIDSDGALDLVVSSGSGLRVYLGHRDGTFTAGPTVSTDVLGRLAAADLDGDGKPEVVAAHPAGVSGSGPVRLFANVGGQLQAGVDLGAPDSNDAWDLAVGDLDGDGKPDLVTAHTNDTKLGVFINQGHLGFASHPRTWPSGQQALALRDLDGDSKPDVVTAGPGSGGFPNVFSGTNTGGALADAQGVGGAIWPTGLALGDFDGDGLPEAVTANSNDDKVSRFERASDGTWQSDSIAGPGNARSALGVDLDGDGVDELVVAYGSYGHAPELIVYRLKAPASQTEILGVSGVYQLASADLDGDGRADLVAAGENGVVVILAQ